MNELQKDFRGKTFGYISAALGLVAGLAWNDAIKFMIESLFPISSDTIFVKFIYAILVTLVVVVLVRYLDRIINREPEKNV